MRKTTLFAVALTACSTPEERHFRRIAHLNCHMEADCSSDRFDALYRSVDDCIDESEIGVALYAGACEDFDERRAAQCRIFLRESASECDIDTSNARYEDYCLGMCSNYQESEPSE